MTIHGSCRVCPIIDAGNAPEVLQVVSRDPQLAWQPDRCGMLPLEVATNAASSHGDAGVAIVQTLLSFGASVFDSERDSRHSLLASIILEACVDGEFRRLIALFDAGMTPDIMVSHDGMTVLMKASQYNSTMVKVLLDRGADARKQTVSGWTALMFACATDANMHQSSDETIIIIDQLRRAGADVWVTNNNGMTALDILGSQQHERAASTISAALRV